VGVLMDAALSKEQLAILRAIRSGRNGHGSGASEDELAQLFPNHLHLLRQLDAEGYVDAYVTKTSPEVRMYHRTAKGEAAVREADD
jgi:hypothetical protein